MVRFMEVCRRAEEGPSVSEDEFDLHILYPTLKELIDKYEISYDADNPVPSDNELADKVFQASVDLIDAVGVYCRNTHRRIEFNGDEIEEAIDHAPKRCLFGEGKEAKAFTPRKPDSNQLPWCHVGSGIAASSEKIASSLIEGYGNITQADSISIPALNSIGGTPIKAGTPLETLGTIRAVEIGRESLRQAGRPGLPIINLLSTSGTALSTIAASNPNFGLRPSDGWWVDYLAELKLELGTLSKAAYLLSWGANIGVPGGPLLGGYCGGPEGTAVVNTAYIIAGRLVFKSNYHGTFPMSLRHSCSTTRDVLWTVSVSGQAISRNIDFPVLSLPYAAAGPATKMLFYETAAYILSAVTSGVSTETVHPAKAVKTDYVTPLEMKFSCEVAYAGAKMTRSQANEIAKDLLAKYEGDIGDAPQGKKYQECYDIETGKPSSEYLELYQEVKEELEEMGVKF